MVRAGASPFSGSRAGLCDHCTFQRLVPNRRGSVFSLCERSKLEPDAFARYPRLPVTECAGFATIESGRPPASGI